MSSGFLFGDTASVIVGWMSGRLGLGMALAATARAYVIGGLTLVLACLVWLRGDAARMPATAFGAEPVVA